MVEVTTAASRQTPPREAPQRPRPISKIGPDVRRNGQAINRILGSNGNGPFQGVSTEGKQLLNRRKAVAIFKATPYRVASITSRLNVAFRRYRVCLESRAGERVVRRRTPGP